MDKRYYEGEMDPRKDAQLIFNQLFIEEQKDICLTKEISTCLYRKVLYDKDKPFAYIEAYEYLTTKIVITGGVLPEYRKQKYASLLINSLIKWFIMTPYETLMIRVKNSISHKLARTCGFAYSHFIPVKSTTIYAITNPSLIYL